MLRYQREFLEFAINQNVLRFGQFTLKSGRQSPYFFNIGLFNTGQALSELGRFYAAAIQESQLNFQVLFGPAYKGIPIVTSAAIALANDYHRHIPYCFNRKEAKDHGEGGIIVGAPLKGKVLLLDDVISAGTAIYEAKQIIETQGAHLEGIVIALDRQERGENNQLATQELEQRFNIKIVSIVTLDNLITYLKEQSNKQDILAAIQNYREEYGMA